MQQSNSSLKFGMALIASLGLAVIGNHALAQRASDLSGGNGRRLQLNQLPAPKVDCIAQYRTVLASNQVVFKEERLIIGDILPGFIRHELTDLEGKYFSVNEELDSGDLLLQIVQSPEYLKGTVSRARLDTNGRTAITEVDNQTTYKLECRRKPVNR